MAREFSNLIEMFVHSCETYTDRNALGRKTSSGWEWTTFSELNSLVDQARGGLAAMGVGPGDMVAVISDNRLEWAVCCYATYGRRGSYVPMYEQQLPKEWKFILEDSGSKICIAANVEIYEAVMGLKDQLPTLERVLCFELPGDHEDSYGALLGSGSGNPVDTMQPDTTETAGFIYTSGTTGLPKGVVLSHSNITSNLNSLHQVFDLESTDVSLAFMPWAHSMGQTCELHGLLSYGASIAVNDEIPNLIANLADVRPTVLFAVPRIFNKIYDGVNKQISSKPAVIQSLVRNAVDAATRRTQGKPVGLWSLIQLKVADRIVFNKIRDKFGGRLRYAVSGSAALSREVGEFIDALGIEVYEGYGLTETSPIATANIPGARKIGSVGRPIPDVRIVIDRSVTDDEKHGEIIIYGPNVMQGYHNRDEETSAVMLEDGGFRSGDMGYLDEDGYLYISGRIKEQYKLENGKYVVPSPLEEQLKLSPFLTNVMLYGHNRPHNVALVVLDMDVVTRWSDEHGIVLAPDLSSDANLRQRIEQELETFASEFKGYERPRNFAILSEDFTTENGMLTPTLKLKRREVLKVHSERLNALYE